MPPKGGSDAFTILTHSNQAVWLGLDRSSCLCLSRRTGNPIPELNLKGAIDFHVHQGPDSVDRAIDADDLARLALKMGMRGMVMKNHFEETGSLVYMVRKEVPGIELFGGITQDLAVGGINLEAVKHMVAMKGGWGRVIWLPTFDAENAVKSAKSTAPFVRVSENGHLVPGVLELIDYIAQHHDLVLETGHISGEEGDMVVHEAHQRGVAHIVVTHAMASYVRMTIPQMQAAAQDGAFIEFVYGATLGANPVVTISDYAKAIRVHRPKVLHSGHGFRFGPKATGAAAPARAARFARFHEDAAQRRNLRGRH